MRILLKHTMLPLVVLFLIGLFFIYKAVYFPPHDFANYYYAAFFLENGQFNPIIYDPSWFNIQIEMYTKNAYAAYAPNTPFLALSFIPLTWFSFGTAKIIFNSISLFLFITSLYRLFRHYKINLNYIFIILILFIVPIKNNILFGQVYFLLFFLITEGFLAYKKNRTVRMSILWSLAILLKVFPILLFLFFLFQKRYKSVLYLGSALVILLFISIFINGSEAWVFYLKEVLPKASNGEISGEFVKNYQSLLMFFKHAFIENTENKNLLFQSNFAFQAAMVSVKLIIVSLGVFYTIKKKSSLEIFSFWVIAFYLLSPYSSSYGSLLLIIPLILVFRENSWKLILFSSSLLFLYTNLPYDFFHSSNLVLSFFKLFALIVFFYSLFLFRKTFIKTQLIVIGLSIILGFSITYISKSKDLEKEVPLLANNNIAFIIDYSIKNNKLYYSYWSEKGLIEKQIPLKANNINTTDVAIIENEIYIRNKKIHLPKSNKKQATIINSNTLIYLSDHDRGFKFYNLKRINITEKKH